MSTKEKDITEFSREDYHPKIKVTEFFCSDGNFSNMKPRESNGDIPPHKVYFCDVRFFK